MCGFAGILAFRDATIEEADLRDMSRVLRHRGPDDAGIEIAGCIGMVHRRLSILDLSAAAHQPMWDTQRLALMGYNGEIYNFQDIRENLLADGIQITSSGDTEVLLQGCLTYGIWKCLPRLDGMFAFVYWDVRRRLLYLARDRMGIKPLYYCDMGNQLVFASEIKAILKVVGAEPDREAVTTVIAGRPVWDPQTLFRGVRAVEPGEMICCNTGGHRVSKHFFRLDAEVEAGRYREYSRMSLTALSERLDGALQNSVRLHMISDVPIAVLASGGVDSSVIAAMGSRRNGTLALYHANVAGPASELGGARRLAGHLRCPLHVADLTAERYARDMAAVTYYHESPSAYHPNDVPFHLICRLAREHGIKVLLTGEGADELFLGYPWMILAATRRRLDRMVARAQAWAPGGRLIAAMVRIVKTMAGRDAVELIQAGERLARQRAQAAYAFVPDPLERAEAVDALVSSGAHLRSLLQRNDRMGMMESLESRIPFLENEIIRMAVNLPPRFRIGARLLSRLYRHPYRDNKLIVRAVAGKYLPRILSQQKKLGFPVEALSYFNVRPEIFRDGFLAELYGLSGDQTDALVQDSGKELLWNLFSTEVFGRVFFGGCGHEHVAEELCRYSAAG